MDNVAGYASASRPAPRRRLAALAAAGGWQALLSFLLPFLLYLRTLAPTVYNLDSAELTTAAATGGILRATGYPLYLLVGRFWAALPIGDAGFRLNLFSAFCGALTLMLLELSLRRLRVGPWARLGALGLLAVAPYFWAMSLIAEVYTLHTALLAAILLACLRWRDQQTPSRLAHLVFLFVLSMANHAATVLALPALLYFVAAGAQPQTRRELLRWRSWRLAAPAALLAASVFLILPLRFAAAPAFNYAGEFNAQGVFVPVNLQTVRGFLWLVTGRSFAGQMFGYDVAGGVGQLAAYGAQLWEAFFAVGIGPGLLGLLLLWRRDRALGGALLLLFLANVLFFVNYRVIDKNTMFLPTYVVWTLWLGVGLQQLLGWLRHTPLLQPARLLLAALVLLAVAWNWQRVDLSHDWSARRQAEAILAQVEPDAIILGWWDTVPAVQYLQFVEQRRPDVLAINRFLISAENMEALIRNEAARRPLYINAPPPALLHTMRAEPAGALFRLYPKTSVQQQEMDP